jgi:predicted transcriptional regulator of viral defense system
MRATKTEQALRLVKRMGVIRPKDLAPHGIAPVYLRRLAKTGELIQSARGLYKLAKHKETAHHNLAEACKLVPNSVVCLLSALHFHRLGKQPPQIWLAIDRKGHRPSVTNLPIRFVTFSSDRLREDTEQHVVEGVPIRVTTCSKTVTDCFRYRNKIGFDVALQALRACIRQNRCPKDELVKCAKLCRMTGVMRPYLEALCEGGVLEKPLRSAVSGIAPVNQQQRNI